MFRLYSILTLYCIIFQIFGALLKKAEEDLEEQ